MKDPHERLGLSSVVLMYISTGIIFVLLFNSEEGQEHAPGSAVTASTLLPTLPGSLIIVEVLCFLKVKIIPLITLTHLF